PCRSGQGRCNGLVAAGTAICCARGTTRWDYRAATRWGPPLPPQRMPSRCRGPAAAAFGTEMPRRSYSLLLYSAPSVLTTERIAQYYCARDLNLAYVGCGPRPVRLITSRTFPVCPR